MELERELLPGTWLVRLKRFEDDRGSFVKTYARSVYDRFGIDVAVMEEFHSISHRGVLRGMHFQLPPHDHAKMTYCACGSVLDVMVDLRPGPGYGQVASIKLDARDPRLLLIPTGVAHGFLALEDNSLMVYRTSTEHSPAHDAGIRWDSFGFEWPQLDAPLRVSGRDQSHPALADFVSPFPALKA